MMMSRGSTGDETITEDIEQWLITEPKVIAKWSNFADSLGLRAFVARITAEYREDWQRLWQLLKTWKKVDSLTYTVANLKQLLCQEGLSDVWAWLTLMDIQHDRRNRMQIASQISQQNSRSSSRSTTPSSRSTPIRSPTSLSDGPPVIGCLKYHNDNDGRSFMNNYQKMFSFPTARQNKLDGLSKSVSQEHLNNKVLRFADEMDGKEKGDEELLRKQKSFSRDDLGISFSSENMPAASTDTLKRENEIIRSRLLENAAQRIARSKTPHKQPNIIMQEEPIINQLKIQAKENDELTKTKTTILHEFTKITKSQTVFNQDKSKNVISSTSIMMNSRPIHNKESSMEKYFDNLALMLEDVAEGI